MQCAPAAVAFGMRLTQPRIGDRVRPVVRLSDWLSVRGMRARHAVAPQPREVAVRKVLTPPGLLLGGRQPPHGVGRKRPTVTGGEPKPTPQT